MFQNQSSHRATRFTFLSIVSLLFCLIIIVWALFTPQVSYTSPVASTSQAYIPLLSKAATPTPVPVPQFVESVPLPNAGCPNEIAVNQYNGYVYVANSYSNNVSVLNDNLFLGNLATGPFPTDMAFVPNSDVTYVTSLQDTPGTNQIFVFEKAVQTATAPDYFEPHDIAYNPINGYVYITDLDSNIRVLDGLTVIADINLPLAGWTRSIAIDPWTGTVYAASWERGIVYVIQGTTVVNSFQAGWGIMDIALDPASGYIYLAHSDPNGTYTQNVSVFHRDDYAVTSFYSAAKSRSVAVDPLKGYAYSANLGDNNVSVFQGRTFIKNVPVGAMPWDVEVNPVTGYAYVTNSESDTVSIFQKGNLVNTIPVGEDPFSVAINEGTGKAYVANRSWHIECNHVGQCVPVCTAATVTILK